ncbi:TPA: hypothetical protein NJ373_003450 [Vibrio parahaemolyticus]|uniref:hypothetical protein n=1 Tax=Vibrio parahaemolyticus TaxID=670 RepID=UPI001A1BE9D8|nr:hypothetical protein [Vibrio parahaemolyticus]EGQ7687477.1 hypothetical protein [Vibrio parahaemolyticus]EGQ8185737.1 hypothetical protein [Vibrio parahaemolyticus]EKQ5825158.1 hypothetical protein [Vibrio parahaemolyticus]HCG7261395.1 hypothetical protein [Vibrio parahaemolyticus]
MQELNQLHGFKVDDWFLSSGRCGEIEVHGPYKTADEACKEAKAKYGVTKLTSPMLIFYPLSAHYVYYVKLSITIRQILSTLLSYLFQILNLS